MKKKHIEKSTFFLLAIFAILVGTSIVLFFAMHTDPIGVALEENQLFKILFVLEQDGKPFVTNVLAYYPPSRRGALFEIPGKTGLIIKSLNRVDAIDVLYTEKNIEAYKTEIGSLIGLSIPFYIDMNIDEFSRIVDILGGLKIFIPRPVDVANETQRFLLPSGAVMLDGSKVKTYLNYDFVDDADEDVINRHQNTIIAFLNALGQHSDMFFSKNVFETVVKNMKSNLDEKSLKRLLVEIAQVDTERITTQRVAGSLREVDGRSLLFPHYDSQLIKDVVRQTTGVLASTADAVYDRIYAIEILNGTTIQGLAGNTSTLYQGFGYDVVRVGNADENNYTETTIIDYIGNQAVAKNLGELINCTRFKTVEIDQNMDDVYQTNLSVDFSIVLGSDFDGRYVRNK